MILKFLAHRGGRTLLEEMASFFENRLEGYDEHMKTEIDGSAAFYPFTASLLPSFPGCRVLDLGCGTGLELEAYFRRCPRAAVTGIDLSRGMLAALGEKFPDKDLTLIRGSYFDVDLGEGYDAAVSAESLHHFPADRKRALYRRLRAALKPAGYFILTDYFAESPALEARYFEDLRQLRRAQGLPEGLYHYDTPLTAEHEASVLREAGFSQVTELARWGATATLRADV